MKFFDYKFLILLGLTVVVYFLYREVEAIFTKINTLEDNIQKIIASQSKYSLLNDKFEKTDLLKCLPNNISYIQELQTNKLDKSDIILPTNTKAQEPCEFSLENNIKNTLVDDYELINKNNELNTDCNNLENNLETKFNDVKNIDNSNTNTILGNIDNNNDSETDTQVNEETSDTESSKHLAIYSNDNEQFEETQNSLLESVIANKNNLSFDYNKMENEVSNLKNTMETIMEGLSTESSSKEETKDLQKSKYDDIIQEKEKQLSEISRSSNKKSSTKSQKMDNSVVPIVSNINNLKLNELKKIAEEHKIPLTKKNNGQQRPKNKNELINEILNKIKS